MHTTTGTQRLMASGLSLLLASCSATRHAPSNPSRPTELSRSVLVIQETLDGQVFHTWQPLSSFDLTRPPNRASNSHFEGTFVRASFNRDCETELSACEEMCRASLKGRNWTHASAGSKNAICRERCRPAYLDCCRLREMSEAVKPRLSFPSVDEAIDWVKQNHRELLVGTVVIIAGIAFVVVVAGSGGGALVLAPAVLLVSSDVSFESSLTQVDP